MFSLNERFLPRTHRSFSSCCEKIDPLLNMQNFPFSKFNIVSKMIEIGLLKWRPNFKFSSYLHYHVTYFWNNDPIYFIIFCLFFKCFFKVLNSATQWTVLDFYSYCGLSYFSINVQENQITTDSNSYKCINVISNMIVSHNFELIGFCKSGFQFCSLVIEFRNIEWSLLFFRIWK